MICIEQFKSNKTEVNYYHFKKVSLSIFYIFSRAKKHSDNDGVHSAREESFDTVIQQQLYSLNRSIIYNNMSSFSY